MIVAFKGATGYEAQVWRVGIFIPYWRFFTTGTRLRIYIDRSW